MLPYSLLKKSAIPHKKRIIAESIILSLEVIDKYDFSIDRDKLHNDVRKYFQNLGWI